ncbi:hypothetical protein ROZALSC1DRAFT_31330 [Rozella allomycis CSF55]|uniref:Uncharacterized protein n=1 Tax=Rozella allomycis (strain CSF55) TaxID=988480 RepID=A0A4P9YC01_ROZAC|nr:hypothetical protein ROZALSC1DRAFT_31330 [Rozella allomycis CSF55]
MKYVAEDQLEDFCALLAVGQKVPFIGFRFWFAFEGVMRVYKCLLSRLESSMALLLVDETDIEDCNCDKKGNDSCEKYRVMNAKLYLFMENRCYKPLVSLSNRSLTVLNFVTQILHDFMPHFERLVATDLKTFNVTRITRDSVLAWCLYRSILHDIVKQRNENIIMIINDLLNIPS